MGEGRSGEKSAKERVYANRHRPSRVEPRKTTASVPMSATADVGRELFMLRRNRSAVRLVNTKKSKKLLKGELVRARRRFNDIKEE